MVEAFWDKLYPLPDEEWVATRVVPLAGLNGVESDGVLVSPILNLPITAAGSLRAMSLVDYQQAGDLERVQDPDKRCPADQSRSDHAGSLPEECGRDAHRVPCEPAGRRDRLRDGIRQACAALEEKCGNGPDGHSLAPPSSNIRNALQAVREEVERLAGSRGAIGSRPAEAAAISAPAAHAANSGPLGTREDAFRTLMQVADFFRRTEPHSPIPYLLEQAVRWGKMPLPELLNELLPAESVPTQSFKLMGIRLPERKEP